MNNDLFNRMGWIVNFAMMRFSKAIQALTPVSGTTEGEMK